MEIIGIYKPYIYSAKFEGEELSEFSKLFSELMDIDDVWDFLNEHKEDFNRYLYQFFDSTFEAAEQVSDEAMEMLSYFEELEDNANDGAQPDFDSYFKHLDGIYKCEINYIPVKGYGSKYRPTLIRLYAIKLKSNVYVISAGGIKLGKKIQDSPGLKENVFKKIDKTREYLSQFGITDAGDMD